MSSSSSVNSSRLLWVVRHGERLDNVDAQWRTNGALPRAQWDDPPLSPRGILQASEVGRHLRGQPIHFIVCSPFSRCLQTTQQIVRQLAQQQQPNLAVLIEPGFCESLNVCQSPPGFPGMDEIRQSFSDLPIDTNYQPFFRPEDLPTDERTNFCCFRRVIGTLKHILDRIPGNLLIVSHGSPISAIHLALSGHLDYMGQCTVSHYRLLGHPANGQLGGDENAAELAAPAIKDDKTIDNKTHQLINSADLPPMSLLPPLGNSIVIRAVPSLQTAACPPANSLPGSDIGSWPAAALAELDANSGDGAPGKRRNTMPVAAGKFRLREVGEERTKDLAVALARLVEAVGTRAEWRPSAECLAAGCSAHLSDRRNLHNRLYM